MPAPLVLDLADPRAERQVLGRPLVGVEVDRVETVAWRLTVYQPGAASLSESSASAPAAPA
jgi:hypothetical protein